MKMENLWQMDKLLEKYLWDNIGYATDVNRKLPRHVINEMLELNMIKSPKQAWATLQKWSGKGLYNYGCCLDLGWKEKDAVRM